MLPLDHDELKGSKCPCDHCTAAKKARLAWQRDKIEGMRRPESRRTRLRRGHPPMSEDQRGCDGPIAEDQSDEAYNRRRADGIICQIDRVFKLKSTDLPLDPSPELWDELTSEETAGAG